MAGQVRTAERKGLKEGVREERVKRACGERVKMGEMAERVKGGHMRGKG